MAFAPIFSPVFCKRVRLFVFLTLQGDDQQQGEGDRGSGAQLRQLQPAAPQRGAGGAQQQHGSLSDRQVHAHAHTHYCLFGSCILGHPH